MAFEWLVKLNDMVSDPATRIARKLHDVEQQLLAIDYAVKRRNLALMNPGIKKDIASLEVQRVKLQLLGGEISKHDRVASSLVARYRHLRESARDWLLILTPLAMGLRFAFNQASALAHAMMAPIRSIEEATIGLRSMYGQKVGDELIQSLSNLGPRIGRPISELFDQAIKFSAAGAPKEAIYPLILAMEDLKAMGRDTGKIQYDIAAMFSRPVLDMNELRRGLSGIVDISKVWDQVAKDIGQTVGNTNFLVSKNMVAGSAGAWALLKVIQGMAGGSLGNKAFERADTTLTGMVGSLEARMEKLFMSITETKGFATLKAAMKNLVDVLGNPGMQQTVTKLANSLGAMLEPLTGPEGKKSMQDFFAAMRQSIDDVLPGLTALIRVTGWFAKRLLDAGGGSLMGAGLVSELATMQGGPISNVLNAIPGMAFNNGIQLSDYAQQQLQQQPNMSKGSPGYPLNISIPITLNLESMNKAGVPINDGIKEEILGQVADAIDLINIHSGEQNDPTTALPRP